MFKQTLFMKVSESKQVYGYFNKGMLELLKYYGQPETVIIENLLDPFENQENN